MSLALPEKVSDITITDEFILVAPSDSLAHLCQLINDYLFNDQWQFPSGVFLAQQGEEIVGALRPTGLFKAFAEGRAPKETLVSDVMGTNIITVQGDAVLKDLVARMTQQDYDAVVVIGEDKKFHGYFSLDDYLEALDSLPMSDLEQMDIGKLDLDEVD